MAMRTKQAKQARRALALRGVAAVAGWSVLFAALAATVLPALWQKAAYVFADVTSPWVYVTEGEYAELQQGSPAYVQQYGDNNPAGPDSAGDTASEEAPAAVVESFASNPDLGFWTNDTLFAVRDLRAYHEFWALAARRQLRSIAAAWSRSRSSWATVPLSASTTCPLP